MIAGIARRNKGQRAGTPLPLTGHLVAAPSVRDLQGHLGSASASEASSEVATPQDQSTRLRNPDVTSPP